MGHSVADLGPIWPWPGPKSLGPVQPPLAWPGQLGPDLTVKIVLFFVGSDPVTAPGQIRSPPKIDECITLFGVTVSDPKKK